MINLKEISFARGQKVLLNEANATLFERQKIALIGANGSGKSTLFQLLLNQLQPDAGTINKNPQLRISHLSQEIPHGNRAAIDYVLEGDEVYDALIKKLRHAESEGLHDVIVECHNEMALLGGYAKESLAASMLHGLGFKSEQHYLPLNSFSGGWRMRLNLAKCLLAPADLLLLDEPTNHLDLEAIIWLERYLNEKTPSFILISHDRDFMDACTSHILHLYQQKLTMYTGNYSKFEKQRAEQLVLQEAQYQQQQDKIAHLMSFVNRFKAKASKAKQAQSRVKAIERMDLIAKAQIDTPFSFEFMEAKRSGNPLIRCEDVFAGYEKPVIKKINLIINNGDRIAFLGPNGAGKSTLIKTLMGELSPISGDIHRHQHLNIGYFAQHQLEALDLSLSPIDTILKITPSAREQEVRDFLGGFDFRGDMAEHPIHHFSGGEKARLILASLVWQKPNLLLLDEPTNHLDLQMRQALELALQSYSGALLLISHDRHLINMCVDDLYAIYNQSLFAFDGSLNDWYGWLQKQQSSEQTIPKVSNTDYNHQKNKNRRIEKLERLIEQTLKSIRENEEALANPTLYEGTQQNKIDDLNQSLSRNRTLLHEYEEEWLTLQETD